MKAKALYFLILFLMGINGALYFSFFSSPPNTDRVGVWFLVFFIIFPLLGLSGVATLLGSRTLKISKWVGGLVLLYVVPPPFLMLIHHPQFNARILDALPQGSFEIFMLILYLVSLIGLLILMPNILRKSSATEI
jgi:hypothetical protein